jgi:glycerol-3-phosphate dehydrogenase
VNRDASLQQVGEGRPWDVLVIGGGATGLGTAVEAATRGYRTLLVEQADFAQATSSRSTKLIHGGVRYLEQGNLRLVREALRERALLLENAPGLVRALPLVIPLQNTWERFYLGIGLKLYDALAGRRGIGRSRHLGASELRSEVPGFAGPAPSGAFRFYDGQFDDARLAIALAQTLTAHGGTALNYARVVELRKQGQKVSGAIAEDRETGARHDIHAKVVVNATGVFSDSVQRMDTPGAKAAVSPSQGIHLVLPRSFLPGETAVLIPRTADGRVLFAIPWQGRVLLGTTDTPVEGAALEPRARPEEVAFLLDHARRFLGWEIKPSDVLSVFAGLRPLANANPSAATAAIARDHAIHVAPSGLVSVTGGKWTTYRLMGEQTVTAAAQVGDLPARPSRTASLRLEVGHDAPGDAIVRAVREEMARTVDDVLSRRTRALILDARAAIEAAPDVAKVMAAELGRDERWQEEQLRAFRELARGYTLDT